MKNLRNIAVAIVAFFAATACQKSEEPTTDSLIINLRNVEGVWQLTEDSRFTLSSAQYLYISLVRDDQSYEMYDNFNSAYSKKTTGAFSLDEDSDGNTLISGTYAAQFSEPWSEAYYIEDFTSETMTWRGEESGNVQKFERVDEVPGEILIGTRSL